jgi:hypothetical protein
MFDFALITVRVPQEVRDIRLPLVLFGDGGDMHGSTVDAHANMCSCAGKKAQSPTSGYFFWLRRTGGLHATGWYGSRRKGSDSGYKWKAEIAESARFHRRNSQKAARNTQKVRARVA